MVEDVVFVRLRLTGEPARIIREHKRRGTSLSVRDVVVQGLLALEERTLERELRSGRSRAAREEEEDE